jgi:hypothetical protein
MKTLILMLAFALALASVALATPLDDKLDAFKAALKKAAAASPATANPRLDAMGGALSLPIDDDAGMGMGNFEAIIKQLMVNSSPDVQAAGKALLAEIDAQKKSRADAIATKVDAVLKDLPDRLAKAQKPEDLDPVLADIQGLQISPRDGYGMRGYGMDQSIAALANKINACYQFTTQWQDYLSAKNNGNTQAAQNVLQNLLNNRQTDAPILIPRSQLLAISAALAANKPASNGSAPAVDPMSAAQSAQDEMRKAVQLQKNDIFTSIKTVDDIAPAVAKLSVLRETGYPQNNDIAQLQRMSAAYSDAKNGLPARIDFLDVNTMQQAPNQPELARIKVLVLLYILPVYLNVAPDQQPQPNETVKDYLNRMSDAAQAKNDWLSLKKIAQTQEKIGYVKMPPEFYAGLDQEAAGQFALAAQSYMQGLRTNSPDLPSKLVGQRLDAIKKDHPDDYALAEKRYQTPPAMPTWPFAGGVPSQYPTRLPTPASTPAPAPSAATPPVTPAPTPAALPAVPPTPTPAK